jgi:hypothetical protein
MLLKLAVPKELVSSVEVSMLLAKPVAKAGFQAKLVFFMFGC